jgi:hypothetical protein
MIVYFRSGGVMLLLESSALVNGSRFYRNQATSGGAISIYTDSSYVVMMNSIFDGNTASQSGGALDIHLTNLSVKRIFEWQMIIVNTSLFTMNHAGYSGGAIITQAISQADHFTITGKVA